MRFSDVVDVLEEQHDEIRRLAAGVQRSVGAERARRFAELSRKVHLHERGEQAVVHPATRDAVPNGGAIGTARVREEEAVERALAELDELGTGVAGFDRQFAALRRALIEHMSMEERDEFPLLRLYVPSQRLHMMVGQLHDVQVMDAA